MKRTWKAERLTGTHNEENVEGGTLDGDAKMSATDYLTDCPKLLKRIFDAINAIGSTGKLQSVRFNDREVRYFDSASLEDLVRLYRLHYRHCGHATCLPDIDNPAMVRRGRPGTFQF